MSKFDFKRISTNDIFQNLSQIVKESLNFQEQALKVIAKRSNGGMRDAQSLLDWQSFTRWNNFENVQNLLGEVSEIDLIDLIDSLTDNNPESLLKSCKKLYDSGNEPNQIINGLLNITRDLLLNLVNTEYSDLYYTSYEFKTELNKFANKLNKSIIIDWHNNLKNVEYQIKTSDNPRLWLEIHLTSLLGKQDLKIINKNDQRFDIKVKENIPSEKNDLNLDQKEAIKFKDLNNISTQIKEQNSSEITDKKT